MVEKTDKAEKEPMNAGTARQVFRRILDFGEVSWDGGPNSHFLQRLRERDLEVADCMNVLRAGFLAQPAEYNATHQEYRYTVATPNITVVVALASDNEVFLVTAWRNKK